MSLLLESGVPAHSVYDHIGPDYQHTPLVTAARLGRLDLVQKLAAAGADVVLGESDRRKRAERNPAEQGGQAPRADTPELARVREWLTQQGLRIDPHCADSRRKLLWASAQPASWPDVPALLALGIPLDATGWSPFMLNLATGVADERAAANLAPEELHHRDRWNRTPSCSQSRRVIWKWREHCSNAAATFTRKAIAEPRRSIWRRNTITATCSNGCWNSGLPLDARNEFGNSALHEAVSGNCVDAAALLLQKGADVHERDGNGYGLIHAVSFPEDLAAQCHHRDA